MKLKTGDHITTRGVFGIDHHGIVDARGRGGKKVIHASKSAGVVVSSLDEFADGHPIGLVKAAEAGNRVRVASRAREALGASYDVLSANCEHLAFRASHELEMSPQLRGAVRGIAVGGGTLLFASGLVAEKGGGGRMVTGLALTALGLLLG